MTDNADQLRTPFVDDALLEQRQQQREVLLSIPKWLADQVRQPDPRVVDAAAVQSLPKPSLAQRLLVERHARDRVDDLLDQLQDGMAGVVDRGVAEAVAGHLDAVLAHGPNHGAAVWRGALADELGIVIDIDEPTLAELVDLLLMADSLADDGFTDLRFA